jgi:formylglycine-generating enzyme required for sulfatase activity
MAESEKIKGLRDFIEDSFTASELKDFLTLYGYQEVASAVNPSVGGHAYFLDVIQTLSRRGLINQVFFVHLTRERPMKEARIRSLQASWLVLENDPRKIIHPEPPAPLHQESVTPATPTTERDRPAEVPPIQAPLRVDREPIKDLASPVPLNIPEPNGGDSPNSPRGPRTWHARVAMGVLALFLMLGIVVYITADIGTASITTVVAGIRLKLIPANKFLRGSPDGEGDANEHPLREIQISRPFYLGIHEVTQSQYQAVMGQNPSYFSSTGGGKDTVGNQSTDQHSVETVSWLDAVRFCNTLSEEEGLTPFYAIQGTTVSVPDWRGKGYRLPTEAEWEYACRAGSTAKYSFGDDPKELKEHAWYDGNSKINGSYATRPVGEKRENKFGLFDMHGNVWEWCWDRYEQGYYEISSDVDPRGPDSSSALVRVLRGGSYLVSPTVLRAAGRWLDPGFGYSSNGFRLARTYD